MKSDVLMLFHLHKDFVFDHTSSWIKPAYTGHEEEWMPSSNAENYINVCDSPRNILEKKKYYPNQTYKEVFEKLHMLWMGIWIHHHSIVQDLSAQVFRFQLNSWVTADLHLIP